MPFSDWLSLVQAFFVQPRCSEFAVWRLLIKDPGKNGTAR